MKKIIVFASALLCVIFTNAQSLHLGVKAGANLGKIHGQSFDDGFKLGYQLGGYAEIGLDKKVDIRPEVLFSQTNTTVTTQPLSGLKPGEKINLNYLNIPVLLQLKSSKLVYIQLGPQYSILMNNQKTVAGNAINAFKNGNFSMLAGLQLNLGALNVYGRYVVGLSNISNTTNDEHWRSQQVQFGLGFRVI